MSHMSQIELRVDDLDALESAATRRGLRLVRDVETFRWYGAFMGDSRGLIDQGVSPEDYGKCAHKLVVAEGAREGYEYEIGVVRQDDGSYVLRFDSWGPGAKLSALGGGPDLKSLKEEYGYAVAEAQAYADGYAVDRIVEQDGSLTLVARQ